MAYDLASLVACVLAFPEACVQAFPEAYALALVAAYVLALLEAYDQAFTKDIHEVAADILAEDILEEGHHLVAFHILGEGLTRQDTYL